MATITELNPQLVWYYFDKITQIPRPSKKEAKIVAFLISFAKEHSLDYKQDAVGNVVIYKKASTGMEQMPTVVLQSHVDMVCEKNSDTIFDFDTDPIHAYIDGGWVKAHGTTLGADCGIGMAAELAILTDPEAVHGPIEALFTVDEETGLTGAFGLGEGMLSGKYLINLDSEDEGEIFIGCAGGIDSIATFKYKPEKCPSDYAYFRIDVSGLKGGHSGDDINKGLANSNKLINRFLWHGAHMTDLKLCYFNGGNLRNAIPREAYVVFGVPAKESLRLVAMFDTICDQIKSEFAVTEPSIDITLSEMPLADFVLDGASAGAIINSLCGVANGVLAMSRSMENFVETSTNLASVKFGEKNTVIVTTSQRSSVESARDEAAASIESTFTLAGATVVHSDGYPGWAPNPDSNLLKITCNSYRELFGVEPKVKAIHAGLECGLFLKKYPWLDMVSFGPTLRGVHSPDERLEIDTVDKFYRLLKQTLKSLSE